MQHIGKITQKEIQKKIKAKKLYNVTVTCRVYTTINIMNTNKENLTKLVLFSRKILALLYELVVR